MDTLYARLNHGRWIADCPHCDGAELVKPGIAFVCLSASDHHGVMYAVEFPPDMDAILQLVKRRPLENRNWEPGETLEMLEAENVAHGILSPIRALENK